MFYKTIFSVLFFTLFSAYLMADPPDTTTVFRIANCDGRFTLGTQGHRLMYGYPYPFSTSHFVVFVDGKIVSNCLQLASNSFDYDYEYNVIQPKEPKNIIEKILFFITRRNQKTQIVKNKIILDNKTYLRDTLLIEAKPLASLRTKISFDYEGIRITQICIPVDSLLQTIPNTAFGQYYRIAYKIENLSGQPHIIGLMVLFDTMMDNNDACKMDAFRSAHKDSVASQLKIYSHSGNEKRGKETEYFNMQVPERILVYENPKKMTKGLTGDFILCGQDATKPDALHIGRWPYFYRIKWIVSNNLKRKYTDSAVLMKWDEKTMVSGDSAYYTTYYGLYNPGHIDLIPINYKIHNYTQFTVTPDVIKPGEKALLRWNVEPSMKVDKRIGYFASKSLFWKNKPVYLHGMGLKDSIWVSPATDKTYCLDVLKNGKVLTTLTTDLKVDNTPVRTDGCFNLGTSSGKGMLFGYPIPVATSHFYLSYNGKNFSNFSGYADSVYYVTGFNTMGSRDNIDYSETQLLCDDLIVKQKIFLANGLSKQVSLSKGHFFKKDKSLFYPVDEYLKPLKYQLTPQVIIEYEIKNKSSKLIPVNFSLLMDVAADGKDNAAMYTAGKLIPMNLVYESSNVPGNVWANDLKGNSFMYLQPLRELQGNAVSSFIVGNWSYLMLAGLKKIKPLNYYDDSGAKYNWQQRSIPANSSVTFRAGAGTVFHDDVIYNYNLPWMSEKTSLYFKLGEDSLSEKDFRKLSQFLTGKPYEYILIESYCDKNGSEELNYNLSLNRAKVAQSYLISTGYRRDKILIKVYGKLRSSKNEEKELDRRVDITILKK